MRSASTARLPLSPPVHSSGNEHRRAARLITFHEQPRRRFHVDVWVAYVDVSFHVDVWVAYVDVSFHVVSFHVDVWVDYVNVSLHVDVDVWVLYVDAV